MRFWSPHMLSGERTDVWRVCICMPRKRRSRDAARDVLVLSFVTQLTAEVLLQNKHTWRCVRSGTRHSKASHSRMIPASLRLLIARLLLLKSAMILSKSSWKRVR